MTAQPRDLAAEVERIRLEVAKQYDHVANRANCDTLLLHIAELERELEEATQAGIDTAREVSDTLSGRIGKLKAENELQREALRWAIENGAHTSTKGLCVLEEDGYSSNAEPPAHLAPILAEAMKEKS